MKAIESIIKNVVTKKVRQTRFNIQTKHNDNDEAQNYQRYFYIYEVGSKVAKLNLWMVDFNGMSTCLRLFYA